jgi:hypothetical protein
MKDLRVKATRMIMGQSQLLQRRMSMARPEPEPSSGMLFRRSVSVPPETSLESLLQKWNPGLQADTIGDLMVSVCRWNQLRDSDAVRSGQTLLIPTVFPLGKEPERLVRRPHNLQQAMPFSAGPRVSPSLAMQAGVSETRMRSKSLQAPPRPALETPRPSLDRAREGARATGNTVWITPGARVPLRSGTDLKHPFPGDRPPSAGG